MSPCVFITENLLSFNNVKTFLSVFVTIPTRIMENAAASQSQLEILIRRLSEAERRAKLLKLEVNSIKREISTLQQGLVPTTAQNAVANNNSHIQTRVNRQVILLDALPSTSSVDGPASASNKRPGDNENGLSQNKKSRVAFSEEDEYVVVYTDGACENNGRPNAKAGVGVWFGDAHPLNISKPVDGRATNNTAEIQACVQALLSLKEHGINKVKIHTDSQFTISCITKWIKNWKRNNWKTASGGAVKNKEDLQKLDAAISSFADVKWDGTTHIVWSRGKHKLYRVNGLNVSSTPDDNGMVRVHLLKNTNVDVELPPYTKPLNILTDKVKVPDEETTYWCHVFKLPEEYDTKHHIYQYESNIQEASQGLVHHMEVFHCEADPKEEIPLYVGNCFAKDRPPKTQVCKRVLAAWAMGAPPFTYPQEAALPIGGEKFNPFIMLEVHYNNPERRADFVDSSGIRFHVSKNLRKMDAGVIELGLEYTDKMAIPPGQESFQLTGYCTSACTSMSLPMEGITIFGSQLHTHLTGIRVRTRHFDAYGKELPELNRDDHFSTHFQEIRRLKKPVKVLPGHVLITRCDYNTEDRENITLGGFSITDEMCVNYIHYYPHTDLEVCKSSISDQALETFFRYMNEWEAQPISTSQGVSENYKAIKWNRMRVQLLSEVYEESPLSMQCNMSSGDRFPGYWENAHIPPVITPLPPPPRKCDSILDEK